MYTKRRLYHPMYAHLLNKCYSKDYSNCEPVHHTHAHRTVPAVNITETEEAFELVMAAPGKSKEDFKIKIDNDLLIISAEKNEDNESKELKFSRKEYDFSNFERRFNLPKDVVDSENISARYENGELFISIPKKEEAKDMPPKDIEIK